VINRHRHIQLLILQFVCWGAVLISTRSFAVDPVGSMTTNSPPRLKSQNMTINLINRLVERGVLSAEDAKELIQQAENDATEARAQELKAETDESTNDTVRVPYIPEIIKVQIRDEIKDDVLKQAREENWALSNSVPAWVSHYLVYGDIRVRYEDLFFPKGNDTSGVFPNFNAINTGAPFDTTGSSFAPQRNVDQDRTRIRLRAELGAEINMENGFTAGLRLATGESDSPVSPNQSLGAANNSQGGNFSAYAVWLDRAFLKYEWGGLPTENLAITIGRFDNPFFSTSIIWDDDLGFDGLALQGKKEVVEGVIPFFAGGAFPIFDTELNFSSTRPQKYPSEDRWLYGGQLGTDWKIDSDFSFKGAAAFYYFANIAGKLSNPFVPLTSQDQGNTDDTRPAFAQYGNTYMALRDITPTAANDFGNIDQWQYYGLASSFHDLAFTGQLDYNHFEPVIVSLTGEFIKNLGFDRGHINALAVNNRGPDLAGGAQGSYVGGDTAWIVGIKVGSAALQKRWDWDVGLDYRYVESDSVVDGFCDSEFGGGGTNVKGYSISAALAIERNIYFSLRWMSSDEVAGPTLKADTLQLDVGGKF
jgi:hypothetical protein